MKYSPTPPFLILLVVFIVMRGGLGRAAIGTDAENVSGWGADRPTWWYA